MKSQRRCPNPKPGVLVLDLHGLNRYQAEIAINAALRRGTGSLYRIHLVHGYHQGTALRDWVRETYADHPQILRLETARDGATDLVLRELY